MANKRDLEKEREEILQDIRAHMDPDLEEAIRLAAEVSKVGRPTPTPTQTSAEGSHAAPS